MSEVLVEKVVDAIDVVFVLEDSRELSDDVLIRLFLGHSWSSCGMNEVFAFRYTAAIFILTGEYSGARARQGHGRSGRIEQIEDVHQSRVVGKPFRCARCRNSSLVSNGQTCLPREMSRLCQSRD